MSIYYTPTTRCTEASERIHQQVEDFLSAGGCINKIPVGQSAHSDENSHWVSPESKAASIRRREIKAEEKRARKRRSDAQRKAASAQGMALTEKARAKRDSLMPRVRSLLAQGKSRREIAAIVDVAHGTINNWLRADKNE